MLFELIYKTIIIIIDINDALRELNILSEKENKNSIDKLMNLMKTDKKTNKSFSLKTIFISFILFAVFISITSDKTNEFLIENS